MKSEKKGVDFVLADVGMEGGSRAIGEKKKEGGSCGGRFCLGFSPGESLTPARRITADLKERGEKKPTDEITRSQSSKVLRNQRRLRTLRERTLSLTGGWLMRKGNRGSLKDTEGESSGLASEKEVCERVRRHRRSRQGPEIAHMRRVGCDISGVLYAS